MNNFEQDWNTIRKSLPPGLNTDWFSFPTFGSYYKLQNGTLIASPALTDGTRENDEGYEVDFDRIDPEDGRQLGIVKERLVFIAALESFAKASQYLLAVWNDDADNKLYPFAKFFDEIVSEVWMYYHDVRDTLPKL